MLSIMRKVTRAPYFATLSVTHADNGTGLNSIVSGAAGRPIHRKVQGILYPIRPDVTREVSHRRNYSDGKKVACDHAGFGPEISGLAPFHAILKGCAAAAGQA
jgi:hypothetical protein